MEELKSMTSKEIMEFEDKNLEEYPVLKELEDLTGSDLMRVLDIKDISDDLFMKIVKSEDFDTYISSLVDDKTAYYDLHIVVADMNNLSFGTDYEYHITFELYKDFKNNRIREQDI